MAISRTRIRGWNHTQQLMGYDYSYDPAGNPPRGWSFPHAYYFPQYYWQSYRAYDEVCIDELHPGPPYRTGGPFFCKRRDMPLTIVESGDYINNGFRYKGKLFCTPPSFSQDGGYETWSQGYASGFGAKGWNKFRPVKPVNSLGQFIAELRDVKGMVTGLKRRLRTLKDAGHHYLNYQFGWKPFLSDLQSFLSNGKKIARRMDYIRRNNGKWVKRGGTVSQSEDVSISTIPNKILPVFVTYFYLPYSTGPTLCQQSVKVGSHVWFEAMMKYYIPNLNSDSGEDLWNSPLLRKMWGLELTPSLVWELLPWSWLVDWFWDVGDFYANLSNDMYDNCVAKYAYVMAQRSIDIQYQQEQVIQTSDYYNGPKHDHTINLDVTYSSTSKERAQASPFGFGLLPDWSNLSGRQLAILSALCVTRTR